jgi:hypothetical protein
MFILKLEGHSKAYRIQLGPFVGDKQFIHIIIDKEVNIIKTKLHTHSIPKVIKKIGI